MSHSREKSRFSKAKILILGDKSVGKTAFAVRYITKRFIGEYDPNKETLYTHKAMLDREEIAVEILDTANDCPEEQLEYNIKWADGFIFLFSITSKSSFRKLEKYFHLIEHLRKNDDTTPLVVVANKADLTFARIVTEAEGHDLSSRYDCPIYEVSIAEGMDGVTETMDDIIRQCKREFVKNLTGLGKMSAFTNVKRVLKKKIYRSRSDTCGRNPHADCKH